MTYVSRRGPSLFADKGYDAESNCALGRSSGAKPHIGKRRQPHGSGLGQERWPVERTNAWLPENKRLAVRCNRLGFTVQALLQAACIFVAAPKQAFVAQAANACLGVVEDALFHLLRVGTLRRMMLRLAQES